MRHWHQGLALLVVFGALAATPFVSGLKFGRRASKGVASTFAPPHGCAGAGLEPRVDLAGAGRATLCLLNAERRIRHLVPLRLDAPLELAALHQSRDMVSRHFFAHLNPDGVDPTRRMAQAGYRIGSRGGTTAENLAYGEGPEATPAAIVDGWMHSPGHRRNILLPRLRDIGIGIVAQPVQRSSPENSGATYTTDFGDRR